MSAPAAPDPFEDDSWKTAEVREAESSLDAKLSESRELLKELDKEPTPPIVERKATEAQIAAVKAEAAKPTAPPALKALKKKVDAGELSWKDVIEGKALADPEVRDAVAPQLDSMREVAEEYEAGASLDDIVAAHYGGEYDPLDTSDRGQTPGAPPPQAPTAEEFSSDPLDASRRQQQQRPTFIAPPPPPPPRPPVAPPTPPAPERHHRPAPAPEEEDYFSDPLSDTPKTPPTRRPASRPKPSKDNDDDGDDYFGGSVLR